MARTKEKGRMNTGSKLPRKQLDLKPKQPDDKEWEESYPIPSHVSTTILFKLNEQQFLFSSNESEWEGLFVYYIHLGDYKKFFEYPERMESEYCLQFDKSKNKLYCTWCDDTQFIIDMNNDNFKMWEHDELEDYDCYNGELLNINGEIHMIGGWDEIKHWTWNDEKEALETIHEFKEDIEYSSELSVLYVPSKEEILMLVWNDDYENTIMLWTFSVKSKKWTETSQLWTGTDSRVQSLSLTSDEKHVIISFCDTNAIHLLKVQQNDYKLYTSHIRIPWFAPNHLMTIAGGLKDNILVVGWIKSIFQTAEFQHISLPPMYLMELINKWYSNEELHWIDICSKRHFTIKMEYVVLNLS